MALYHFRVEDGISRLTPDPVELGSVNDARIAAARTLGELIRDEPDGLWKNGLMRLTVADHADMTLFEILVVATDSPALTGRRG